MRQDLIVLTAVLTLSGCVSTSALEPPQIARGGAEARSSSSTVEMLGLQSRDIATDLDTPWDMVWGPDGWIWFTERPGRLSRVNPASGHVQLVAEVPGLERGEGGLMGLALHPDFPSVPYIYLSQSYADGSRIANRLLRFRYGNGALTDKEVLLESIPGNTFHDGSRLAVGPDRLLYMTTGDAGNPALAQDSGSLAGKVLRLTLDGVPAPGNPFGSAVYSLGHRNPQGMVFNPRTGLLYLTEHGPRDNDEVSIVLMGGNYGWPGVHGFVDDDVSGETEFARRGTIVEPIAAWTPTIAPAGADFYESDAIPGWTGSLLFVTLKGSSLVRLTLSPDGLAVAGQEVVAEGEYGRLRDVLVGPDGSIYLATSNQDGRGSPRAGDDRIIRLSRR